MNEGVPVTALGPNCEDGLDLALGVDRAAGNDQRADALGGER